MTLINTHATVKKLIKDGFSEKQAESLVEIVNSKNDEVVTKNDLKIAILELKSDLLKWMIPFFLTIIGLIITAFFKH
jgi:hypothetical protein